MLVGATRTTRPTNMGWGLTRPLKYPLWYLHSYWDPFTGGFLERSSPWAVLEAPGAPVHGSCLAADAATVSLPGFGFPSKVRLNAFLKTTTQSVRTMKLRWRHAGRCQGLTFVASCALFLLVQLGLSQRLHHIAGLLQRLLAVPQPLEPLQIGIFCLLWVQYQCARVRDSDWKESRRGSRHRLQLPRLSSRRLGC